jgi:DNA-binding transcriptional LysR family regulator
MKRLHGLELFVEVAKAKSFSRAADVLGVPKSTLSRQIAELERAVGLRLLSRTTRKVSLTDAGQLYLDRCQRIVAEAQIAHEELQNLVDTPVGPLRVNMPADFGTDFLADAFVGFAQKYPAVTFHLDLASPEHAGQVFQSCDVAIEVGTQPDSSQVARLLGWIPAFLYASPDYLKARGTPTHPSQLHEHDCVQFRARTGNRVAIWPLHNKEQRFEFEPKGRFSVNSVAMLRRITALGGGITALDEAGSEKEVEAGRLVLVLPEWSAGPFPVYALTETRLLPAKTRIFVQYLSDRLGDRWGRNTDKNNLPYIGWNGGRPVSPDQNPSVSFK